MEEMTESEITQDYEYTTKSTSLYLKTASPKSLNSKYGGGGPIKSPKQSEKNVLCARESHSPVLQSSFLECHSASPLSMSRERGEKMWYDVPHDTAHGSGPTPHFSRKRMYIEDNGINSYKIGLEEEELRTNLLVKKLSKMEAAAHPTDKGSESISSLSTNAFSISGENWKSEISGVHLCEQSSTEQGRKSNVSYSLIFVLSPSTKPPACFILWSATSSCTCGKLDRFRGESLISCASFSSKICLLSILFLSLQVLSLSYFPY